jgi:hypothetical protein
MLESEWPAMDRMSEDMAEQLREKVDEIYRSDSRRVFATLLRLLGDFDLAEDALYNAFAALEQWPKAGVPANPRAWLVSAASRRSTPCAVAPGSTRLWRSSPTAWMRTPRCGTWRTIGCG